MGATAHLVQQEKIRERDLSDITTKYKKTEEHGQIQLEKSEHCIVDDKTNHWYLLGVLLALRLFNFFSEIHTSVF